MAIEHVGKLFTVKEVSDNLNVSDNTARSDLRALVECGLFEKIERGKQTLYVSPKSLKGVLDKLKKL